MTNRFFPKFIGLLILYSCILLGIFVIQFKNESIIIKTIGPIKATMFETKNQKQQTVLQNKFQIVYNSFSLYSDENHAVKVVYGDDTEEDLNIESYEIHDGNEESPESLCIGFKSSNSETVNPRFFISADKDSEIEALSIIKDDDNALIKEIKIPYKFLESFNIEMFANKAVLSSPAASDDSQYLLSAARLEDDYLVFNGDSDVAKFAPYVPDTKFTFEQIPESSYSSETTYNGNIDKLRHSVASVFDNNQSHLSELMANIFIAERYASNSRTGVISKINESLPLSRRTYLSSPYLDNIVSNYKSLQNRNSNQSLKITSAIKDSNLSVFEIDDLLKYCYMANFPIEKEIVKVLPEVEIFEPTEVQAAAILKVYADACDNPYYSNSMTSLLNPYLEKCVATIEAACVLDGEKLLLSNAKSALNFVDVARISKSLIAVSSKPVEGRSSEVLKKAGYSIFNSVFQNEIKSVDMEKISFLYPLLVENNYLPHFEILSPIEKETYHKPVSVWTMAKISMKQSGNTIQFNLTNQVGSSHYMIFTNVNKFKTIMMYDMAYRSAKDFQNYDSPGYVYDEATKTLFVKMRHKKEVEKIILYY